MGGAFEETSTQAEPPVVANQQAKLTAGTVNIEEEPAENYGQVPGSSATGIVTTEVEKELSTKIPETLDHGHFGRVPGYFPFLKLPKEVRDMVMRYLYATEFEYPSSGFEITRNSNNRSFRWYPSKFRNEITTLRLLYDGYRRGNDEQGYEPQHCSALLFSSHALMAEATQFLLATKSFNFSTISDANGFLDVFSGHNAYTLVEELVVNSVSAGDFDDEISDNLGTCTSLRTLRLEMSEALADRFDHMFASWRAYTDTPLIASLLKREDLAFLCFTNWSARRSMGYQRRLKDMVKKAKILREAAARGENYEGIRALERGLDAAMLAGAEAEG
ncbi:hypothetical protein K490DRAFT_55199 [Saccharata proteae CBS 121410]|uniref:Uncharacterized protein n=1 Tax=Saccharata proteae CBS 121410 TaxID=1314787 RepID=A0A6A5YDM1_9PEZI|nr:hypothetical protein K490DRAFT_55199 [Saccharata proteae CBS 121410]